MDIDYSTASREQILCSDWIKMRQFAKRNGIKDWKSKIQLADQIVNWQDDSVQDSQVPVAMQAVDIPVSDSQVLVSDSQVYYGKDLNSHNINHPLSLPWSTATHGATYVDLNTIDLYMPKIDGSINELFDFSDHSTVSSAASSTFGYNHPARMADCFVNWAEDAMLDVTTTIDSRLEDVIMHTDPWTLPQQFSASPILETIPSIVSPAPLEITIATVAETIPIAAKLEVMPAQEVLNIRGVSPLPPQLDISLAIVADTIPAVAKPNFSPVPLQSPATVASTAQAGQTFSDPIILDDDTEQIVHVFERQSVPPGIWSKTLRRWRMITAVKELSRLVPDHLKQSVKSTKEHVDLEGRLSVHASWLLCRSWRSCAAIRTKEEKFNDIWKQFGSAMKELEDYVEAGLDTTPTP
ncbi:unnamed protein product [Periconia digitata]|uniref:Uncharacterized protein n=1 Tax=Periconia digitata TaxID=1303443 RepID=A0A9W4XTH6_9PLEO|nr:unnamed protein product [Periconia digitata]